MAVCSETYMAVCEEITRLQSELEKAEARVAGMYAGVAA